MTMVCAWCGVYAREERDDGRNNYTVCVYCGRSELRFVSDDRPVHTPVVPRRLKIAD